MYDYPPNAAKGETPGRQRHLLGRSMQRAAVNIYKTANSLEMLVFAPGRIKEHFQVNLATNQLTVSYVPPEGFSRPDWVLREYSRGGFQRTFAIDPTIDTGGIRAKYEDGVLHISLPQVQGTEAVQHQIAIS